jgi:hypothetical protein
MPSINLEGLISQLERRAQQSRAQIGKTRTKLESNELKGEVFAFNEAIYMVKEYARKGGQVQSDERSAATLEPVDAGASYHLDSPDADGGDVIMGSMN